MVVVEELPAEGAEVEESAQAEEAEAPKTDDAQEEALAKAEACRQAGNERLARGDLADACQSYDEGLLAIVRLGNGARELRTALHLNASLAHLRRGNLASAVDHATGALASDPKSVKALYRRGQARARLAEQPGHEAEAARASADFEEALRLEPGHAEVRKALLQVKALARAEQRDLAAAQKKTFANVFASGKPLYEEAKVEKLGPVIRAQGDQGRELLLSTKTLSFAYDRSEPVLQGVDLEFRKGWCVGLFGNNSSGKTTLARLLIGKLAPNAGEVEHHGLKARASTASSIAMSAFATVCAAMAAVICGVAFGGDTFASIWRMQRVAVLAVSAVVPVAILLLAWGVHTWQNRGSRHRVIHVSADSADKEHLNDSSTIEQVIGEMLPKRLKASERRERVVALLSAGGLQMYDQSTMQPVGSPAEYVRDKLRYGQLSGGQRHLVYVLRCFAANPAVLVCDELLSGLDQWRQPRVLHMLNRMKKELGTSVLYITCELHPFRLVADSIGFMSEGQIVELGPAEDVLDFPKHPETQTYVSMYRGMPGCSVIGGKLAENYGAVAKDEALAGNWLPV